MNADRLRAALKRVQITLDNERYIDGLLGRPRPGSDPEFVPRGLARHKYVRINNSSGSQSVVRARDDSGTPESYGLAVRLRIIDGVANSGVATYAIERILRDEALATVPPPGGSGVPPHTHDDRYFRENEFIDVSTGAPDAGKPAKLGADGKWDASMIDTAGIVEDAISGAATDDTIIDADLFGYVTGGTLVKTAWSNIKAVFKTYYDSVVATLTNKSISGATNTITALPTSAHDDNSITYAKMQDIATDSLIGRDTAATGDPETISLNATLSMTGAGTLQRAALTGDVTASAGSNATTIANDAVTFAKMQNIATDSVLGRATAGTGDIELITLTAFARTLIDDVNAAAGRATLGAVGLTGDENVGGIKTFTSNSIFSANVNVGVDALATNVFNISHATAVINIIRYVNSVSGPVVILRKSRNASVGSHTVVQNNDELGRFDFRGSDGAAFIDGAQIMALVDGTPGTNDMPGRIEFRTTPDGSSTPVLRVTIDKDGNVTMINGTALTVETIKAVDATGLVFKDNGGNTGIILEDSTLKLLLNGLTSAGANALAIKPGTSSNDAAVGGKLYSTISTAGNVGTGEDDLASYSVPANTLSADGMALTFEAWGTFANNANAKTLRVRFGTSGTTLVADGSLLTGAAGQWRIRGRIIRTGAATQKAITEINNSNASPGAMDVTTALNQTLSGAVTLKVTGEATSNNDIVLEEFIVSWEDTNT